MRNFQELDIWKLGIDVVKACYLLAKDLPNDERFGLISQMTRAAVSIPANIAEGNSRTSDKDNARFIQIALGSAFELQTYLVIVNEMNWSNPEKIASVDIILRQEIKMLYNFLRKLGSG